MYFLLTRVPLAVFCAVPLVYVWMTLLEQPDPQVVANYWFGVFIFAVSTIIELSAQPLLVLAQATLFVKLKVRTFFFHFFFFFVGTHYRRTSATRFISSMTLAAFNILLDTLLQQHPSIMKPAESNKIHQQVLSSLWWDPYRILNICCVLLRSARLRISPYLRQLSAIECNNFYS